MNLREAVAKIEALKLPIQKENGDWNFVVQQVLDILRSVEGAWVDVRKNKHIPLTCKNCYLLDIWTCKAGATGECSDPYKRCKPDCPAVIFKKEGRKND